jgi:formylglycine-generating enzyme required for sulfatase activity
MNFKRNLIIFISVFFSILFLLNISSSLFAANAEYLKKNSNQVGLKINNLSFEDYCVENSNNYATLNIKINYSNSFSGKNIPFAEPIYVTTVFVNRNFINTDIKKNFLKEIGNKVHYKNQANTFKESTKDKFKDNKNYYTKYTFKENKNYYLATSIIEQKNTQNNYESIYNIRIYPEFLEEIGDLINYDLYVFLNIYKKGVETNSEEQSSITPLIPNVASSEYYPCWPYSIKKYYPITCLSDNSSCDNSQNIYTDFKEVYRDHRTFLYQYLKLNQDYTFLGPNMEAAYTKIVLNNNDIRNKINAVSLNRDNEVEDSVNNFDNVILESLKFNLDGIAGNIKLNFDNTRIYNFLKSNDTNLFVFFEFSDESNISPQKDFKYYDVVKLLRSTNFGKFEQIYKNILISNVDNIIDGNFFIFNSKTPFSKVNGVINSPTFCISSSSSFFSDLSRNNDFSGLSYFEEGILTSDKINIAGTSYENFAKQIFENKIFNTSKGNVVIKKNNISIDDCSKYVYLYVLLTNSKDGFKSELKVYKYDIKSYDLVEINSFGSNYEKITSTTQNTGVSDNLSISIPDSTIIISNNNKTILLPNGSKDISVFFSGHDYSDGVNLLDCKKPINDHNITNLINNKTCISYVLQKPNTEISYKHQLSNIKFPSYIYIYKYKLDNTNKNASHIPIVDFRNPNGIKITDNIPSNPFDESTYDNYATDYIVLYPEIKPLRIKSIDYNVLGTAVNADYYLNQLIAGFETYSYTRPIRINEINSLQYSSANKDILEIVKNVGDAYHMSEEEIAMFGSIILTTANNNYNQNCLDDVSGYCRYKGLAAIDTQTWVEFKVNLYDGSGTAYRNFKEVLTTADFTTINNLGNMGNGFGSTDSKIDNKDEYLELIDLIETIDAASNTLQQKYASVILAGAIFSANKKNVILDSKTSSRELTYLLFANNQDNYNADLLDAMFILGYKQATNGSEKFVSGISNYDSLDSEIANVVRKELLWYLSYKKDKLLNITDTTGLLTESVQNTKKANKNNNTYLVNLNKPFDLSTQSIRSPVSIELDGFDNETDPIYMFIASSKSSTAKDNISKFISLHSNPIKFNKSSNNTITKSSLNNGDVFYKIDRSDLEDNKLKLEIENTIDGILIAFYKYSDFAGDKSKADYFPTRTKEDYEKLKPLDLVKGQNYEFTYAFIINESKEDASKFNKYIINQNILNFYDVSGNLIFPHPFISPELTDLLGDIRSIDPNTYYLFNSVYGNIAISLEEHSRQYNTSQSILLREMSFLQDEIDKRNEEINKLLGYQNKIIKESVGFQEEILILESHAKILESSIAKKIGEIRLLESEVLNGNLTIADLQKEVDELKKNNENLIISLCSLEGLSAADYLINDDFNYTKFFKDFETLRLNYETEKSRLNNENTELKDEIEDLKNNKNELINVLESLMYTPVDPINSYSGDSTDKTIFLLENEIHKLYKLNHFFEDNDDFLKIVNERIIFINSLILELRQGKLNKEQLIESLNTENNNLRTEINSTVKELLERNTEILKLQKDLSNRNNDSIKSDNSDIINSFMNLIDKGEIAQKLIKFEEIITEINDPYISDADKAEKLEEIEKILNYVEGKDYPEKLDNLKAVIDNVNFFKEFISQNNVNLSDSSPLIDIINLNTLRNYSQLISKLYCFDSDQIRTPINYNPLDYALILSSTPDQDEGSSSENLSSIIKSNFNIDSDKIRTIKKNFCSDEIIVSDELVADCDDYISKLIDDFEMRTDLQFSEIIDWGKVDTDLLEIIKNVADAFNMSEEERAQYYAIMVQESGNSANRIGFIEDKNKVNCIGPNLIYNDSTENCENKSHLGIGQISRDVWIYNSNYLNDEFDNDVVMKSVFNNTNFGYININGGANFGGDNGFIENKDEYKTLLEKIDSIFTLQNVNNLTSEQRYSSAIFGAALFLRNKKVIINNQKDDALKKITDNMFKTYDPKTNNNNNESLDIMFANGYKYYRTSQNFKDGIKEYVGDDGSGDNLLAAATESARQKMLWYLAYKKSKCLTTSQSPSSTPSDTGSSLQDKIIEKAIDFMNKNKCYADIENDVQFNCTGFLWHVLNAVNTEYSKFSEENAISNLKIVVLNQTSDKSNSTYYGPYIAASLNGSYFTIEDDVTDYSNLKKGDILYFADFTHAGIYIGEYTSNGQNYTNAVIHSGKDNDGKNNDNVIICESKNGIGKTSIVNIDEISQIRGNMREAYGNNQQYLFVLRLSNKISFNEGNFNSIKDLTGAPAVNKLKRLLTKTYFNGFETAKLSCPTGYVLVPNDPTYNTGDFCVMQFEAKMDNTGDGIGDNNATCKDSNYNSWDNRTTNCGFDDPGNNVVSSAVGYPITSISQAESIEACESIGEGYHLITNDEWMTIARNIEAQAGNWTSGTVGNGSLFMGNNGGTCTVGTACYNGDNPEYTVKTEADITAKLVLSNGNEIWDLSGNVAEWVDKTITRGNMPSLSTSWLEYTSVTDYGLLGRDSYNFAVGKKYNSSNGVGKIYNYYSKGSTEERVFLRGGSWLTGTTAGLLYLSLSYDSSTQTSNHGFRCAVVP